MNFLCKKPSLIFISIFLLVSVAVKSAGNPVAFNPKKGDHLVFLGNTFADRMRYYGYFETLIQKSYPGKQLTVRNMGWSGDEPALQPRPLNFSSLHDNLTEQKADFIFLCFGMNESFKGKAGLPQYEKDLVAFINDLKGQKFNGLSFPQLILVSPIAHQDLGGYLPNPSNHNQDLALYTAAMQHIAETSNILFIDLFNPSLAWMKANPKEPLTINGIHLNDKGYMETGKWMAQQLGFGAKSAAINLKVGTIKKLEEVIRIKDQHFLYRWRAVNGEYIYGRRKEPFGVKSYPPEIAKLNRMLVQLDNVIWQMSINAATDGLKKAMLIVDERSLRTAKTAANKMAAGHANMQHSMPASTPKNVKPIPATTAQFTVPEGYEVNLFASEKDFPVEKPVCMAFDARGRLWMASMPTYPQHFPGFLPNDKIVILEDTNADGRADKHTVFADNLYLPLGFDFGNGGVYVSQEPDIYFLKDTTGDDRADVREVVLMGFGSEDSHHATHAYSYGQDGALYFNEGTFLHSQIETPYGPVRSYNGTTFRFEPRTWKVSSYISYGYDNPWGNVFDKWGMHLIADASNGSNYYATPMTGKIDYPVKHTQINTFTTTRVRPTAGIEYISSRQFPDSVQGDVLINNTIGFQGIKHHQVIVTGSGITSKEVEPLLQSSDPNFRPVDLKFGPDGALYVADWYNPLIGHMQYSLRDPGRDKSHGRIWRITYKGKPVLKSVDISKQSLPQLFENLKAYEDRFRYRSRAKIREQDPAIVLPALRKWVSEQDKNDTAYEHSLLEGLWLYQDFDSVNTDLLKKLLVAKDYRARAAATRVLLYWKDSVENSLELLRERVNDDSPRVRLEAIVALSYFNSDKAVIAALDILKHPTDYYLEYGINETLDYLKPVWLQNFKKDQNFLADDPKAAARLLSYTSLAERLTLPQTPLVLSAMLSNMDGTREQKVQALQSLAKQRNTSPVNLIIEAIRLLKKPRDRAAPEFTPEAIDLISILLTWDKAALNAANSQLIALLDKNENNVLQSAGYAALITATGSDKPVWPMATQSTQNMTNYLNGISLLKDSVLQTSFYEKVKTLTQEVPQELKAIYPANTEGDDNPAFNGVRSTAYRVLFKIPGNHKEKVEMVTDLFQPNGPFLNLATDIVASQKINTFSNAEALEIVKNIITVTEGTAEKQKNSIQYNSTIVLGKRLASLLPKKEAAEMLAVLENTGTIEVKIATLPAKMLFDKNTITIPSGRSITVVFDNPDQMPHNVVIMKPGAYEKVGKAADAMAGLKDGFEKNFVPSIPEVLFATPLVNAGKSFRLNFKAPDTPGDYPFICSFPGHWRMMKGIFRVIEPGAVQKRVLKPF